MNFGDNNGMYMPVAPAYGYGYGGGMGGGFLGGDGGWLVILILALMNGGWGFGGMGGGMMWPMMMGGMAGGWDLYPWLDNSQNINTGFRDQMITTFLSGISDKMSAGFGDVQLGIAGINQNICQTGSGITAAINNGFSGAEIAANGRQQGLMQQLFGMQSAQQLGQCDTRAAIADLKYTIAQEGCADRAAVKDASQVVLDKLCQLELDNEKALRAADQREIVRLNNELLFSRSQADRIALAQQTVDQTYNRLQSCPVGTYAVCNPNIYPGQNTGCGCGCGVTG